MKIQSRPPVSTTPKFDEAEMTCMMRDIMEIQGNGTSDVYRKVLAEGAAAMWLRMGVIADYQVCFSNRGYYGIAIDVRLPEGDIAFMYI